MVLHSQCYDYSFETESWHQLPTPTANLIRARSEAAAVAVMMVWDDDDDDVQEDCVAGKDCSSRRRRSSIDSIWITGGRGEEQEGGGVITSYLNSTEILLVANGSFVRGPDLPVAEGLASHCVAKLSERFVALVGGQNDEGNSRAGFLYNQEEASWTQLPDMIDQRAGHVCEVT